MRLTRLHQIAARRGEPAETLEFYGDRLGARHLAEFDPPGLMFFEFDGVRLLLEAQAPLAVIYFRVDDIQASYEALQDAGIQFEDEPHLIHTDEDGVFDNPGTSEWMVFFKDPAGNTLALASRTTPEG